MDTRGGIWLIVGAGFSSGIALMHVVIIFIGAPAYLYFGAADLARLASRGSLFPALLTLLITAVFMAFGSYALSGAGLIRRLPFLVPGLFLIGGVYTLRGLIVVQDLIRMVRGAGYPFRQTAFSAVSLIVGLVHFIGIFRRRAALKKA